MNGIFCAKDKSNYVTRVRKSSLNNKNIISLWSFVKFFSTPLIGTNISSRNNSSYYTIIFLVWKWSWTEIYKEFIAKCHKLDTNTIAKICEAE